MRSLRFQSDKGQRAAVARLIAKADAARDTQDWSAAARDYSLALDMRRDSGPDMGPIWVQLGNVLKEQGDLPASERAYAAALQLIPDDADASLQFGRLMRIANRPSEALAHFHRALEVNPHLTDARREIAHATHDVERSFRLPRLNAPNLNVLYVSDSLGTPIHPRGIFNYSVSMVEMLKEMGARVTLVVERAKGFGVPRAVRKSRHLSRSALDSSDVAEVYRYFNSDRFDFSERFDNPRLQALVDHAPWAAKLLRAALDLFPHGRSILVENSADALDFRPAGGAHLSLFDRFLIIDRVYSESMTRGVNRLTATKIDARGFDLVIVDTPHYVRVTGIDRQRTFVVIHDLIPFSDPLMGLSWKKLFFAKVDASLALGGNVIFVSEYTQSLFHKKFPAKRLPGELVIYPSIKRSLLANARPAPEDARSDYLTRIVDNRSRERARNIADRARRLGCDEAHTAELLSEFQANLPSWDPSLPYFATTVSDEARKNIKIIVEAAQRLQGRANFIIVGQVDGNAYMEHEPELFPNLHFAGYVSDWQKNDIVRHSAGVIFASFSEGFGIPVVEGSLFAVPVVCSDIPVFREITQGLATYFDPYDCGQLVDRLLAILDRRDDFLPNAEALRDSVMERFSQGAMAARMKTAIEAVFAARPADSARPGEDAPSTVDARSIEETIARSA